VEFTAMADNTTESKEQIALKKLEKRTNMQLLIPDFSPKKFTVTQVMRYPDNRAVIIKFFIITALMFTVPFLVFVYVNNMEDIARDDNQRTVYAAIAAVISVQCIIGLYICLACYENDEPPKQSILRGPKQTDKDKSE